MEGKLMWGTIVNTAAVIGGGILGSFLKGGISERFREIIMQGIGLAVCLIGIQNALKTTDIFIVIISLIIGGTLGEWWKIEDKLDRMGQWAQKKFSKNGDNSFSQGFVTASLVYCVGAMAIVGALESGLKGEYGTLYAKSILDGISAIIFSSTLGIGVAFSAISVFLYQGAITVAASFLQSYLSDPVITEMTAVGGLLILAIGLSLLGIKKFKVGNLLPSIFVPIAYFPIAQLISKFF